MTKIDIVEDNKYLTRSIIIATGSNPRHLDVKGYQEYWGKGISTCAVCDGSLPCYRNVPIAVIGGGDSACEFALHLSKTASKVYLIHRGEKLSKASSIMVSKVTNNNKIEIIYNTFIISINGNEKHISSITTNNGEINVGGLFVAIGHIPNTSFLKDLVLLDEFGHIIVNDRKQANLPGIYAAGDVEDHLYKQAITAAASGCIAALEIENYLNRL